MLHNKSKKNRLNVKVSPQKPPHQKKKKTKKQTNKISLNCKSKKNCLIVK